MPTLYMDSDVPYEERVQGLYPMIEQTLTDWAAGKVSYEEFSDFMDYIQDEINDPDLRNNFFIGTLRWGWGEGKLFLPEDVPIFLDMLKYENLYSQDVLERWNTYWKNVDIKKRALDYLKNHPDTTDQQLDDILWSLPGGEEIAFDIAFHNKELFLKLQSEYNERYIKRMELLLQEVKEEFEKKRV